MTSTAQSASDQEGAEVERLERFKADFVVLLAQQIREPLRPLMGCLDIVRREASRSDAREGALSAIERQIDRLNKLVDGLLELSRVTYGRIPLRQEQVDFAHIVRQIATVYRQTCERSGLKLTVKVPETAVCVLGDSIRLMQVVAGLVENACTFTGAGGLVEIHLETDPAASQLLLRIRDNGKGIDPSLLGNLFEPFCEAHRSQGGLGLGLALVKGLVSLHGGSVEAHSEGLRKGTEFHLRLPLGGEAPVVTSMPKPAPTGKPRRVLVIEDNVDGTDTLRRLLEMAGHEVRAAATGPEGVRVGAQWRPDVVLCDINLPGLDGYRVADALREQSVAPPARLIAITGYGATEDKERAQRHGFEAHLTKPADPTFLLSLVAQPASPG